MSLGGLCAASAPRPPRQADAEPSRRRDQEHRRRATDSSRAGPPGAPLPRHRELHVRATESRKFAPLTTPPLVGSSRIISAGPAFRSKLDQPDPPRPHKHGDHAYVVAAPAGLGVCCELHGAGSEHRAAHAPGRRIPLGCHTLATDAPADIAHPYEVTLLRAAGRRGITVTVSLPGGAGHQAAVTTVKMILQRPATGSSTDRTTNSSIRHPSRPALGRAAYRRI
jgi:hypothetical protein